VNSGQVISVRSRTNGKQSGPEGRRGHVIVLGNEKGGSGKSTSAMHLIAGLMKAGFKVGCIDLDSRQRSISRYLENRRQLCDRTSLRPAFPRHEVIDPSTLDSKEAAQREEESNFEQALFELRATCDFVVVDCPGSDVFLSRVGHRSADTLITPMNDSFVDFDLLGKVDPDTNEVMGPSIYSEMVWEARKRKAMVEGKSIDWVVMRNRLSHLDAKNKRRVEQVLTNLAGRIGFRLAPGFGERVIFREMFPMGLTLLDIIDDDAGVPLSMSHIAARQEVRDLLTALRLPGLDEGKDAEAAQAV